MTTDRVQRRIASNALLVSDGLEKLQADILELFNSRLDQYRAEMLERDEVHVAMLTTLTYETQALREGIVGLSHQISEYEALALPAARMQAAHERRLEALEAARDG